MEEYQYYIYIYNKTSIKRNILTIKKIHREVGRAKDLSAPLVTNKIGVPLANNQWLYCAPTADSVEILCSHQETAEVTLHSVGRLAIRAGSALLQTSNIITVRKNPEGEDLLLQPPLPHVCCAENSFNVNFSKFSLDVHIKQAFCHFEDLKSLSYKTADLEKGIVDQELKSHHTQRQIAYSVQVCILLTVVGSYNVYKIYLLTPCSKVLLEKLTGFQLVKKFPAFYGTHRFITAFT